MQIKKFEAKNMAGALRMIRNEFGEDAVILSAKSLRREKGLFGAIRNVGVEVTAAKDAAQAKDVVPAVDKIRDTYTRTVNGAYAAGTVVNAGRNFTPSMDSTATDVPRKIPGQYVNGGSLTSKIAAAKKCLIEKGVETKVASELMQFLTEHTKIDGTLTDRDLRSGLIRMLEKKGLKGKPIQSTGGRQKIVALVGGTGDGKTETIAKLAARQIVDQRQSVALVSLDCHRVAANARLQTYAKIFGVPFKAVSEPQELVKTLAGFENKSLVLIDTPGLTNENKDILFETLRHARTNFPIDIFPVVSALTREDITRQMLREVEPLSPRSLIISKVDACRPSGPILNLIVGADASVAYFTNGRRIPEDMTGNCLEMLLDSLFPPAKAAALEPQAAAGLSRIKTVANGASPSDARTAYVASTHSDVYHASACKLVKRIKAKNRIRFECEADARKQDLIPCGFCLSKSAADKENAVKKRSLFKIAG